MIKMRKLSQNTIELFDEFYDPETSKTRKESIKKTIEAVPELKDELREYGYLLDTIKLSGRLLLRKKLDVIHNQYFKKTIRSKRTVDELREKASALFKSFFTPYMDLVTVRNSSEKGEFKKAMEYYSARKYNEALDRLKKLVKADPENILIIFYTGISFLSSGNSKESLKFFNKIIRLKNPAFKNIVLWYASLAYLHQGNYNMAIKNINKIDKSSVYHKKANSLLKKLSGMLIIPG
jgi:tetratricopeptide (TPR) repeat protein